MNETRLSRLLLPVGTPIGRLASGAPVYPFLGAAKEDDITVEPEDDDPEGGEEGGDGGDKYTPPARAEWLRTQAALAKANASAKQRREALAEAEKEIQRLKDAEAAREAKAERDALTKGSAAKKKTAGRGGVQLPEGAMTPAQIRQLTAQAAREAEAKAAEKLRNQVVSHAARAALVGAGVSKSAAARLAKLLDLDDIGIDEDGEITDGLDEQVQQLREEMPQLFPAPEKKQQRRTPPARVNGADRPAGEGERRLSSAEKMAQMALGARQ